MKQFVRSRKMLWNLIFLVLFLALVFIKPSKIITILTFHYGLYIGILLIVNRIYLVKGSIKRLPYFLSLLILLSIPVILIKIISSATFLHTLLISSVLFFTASYFKLSFFCVTLVNIKFYKWIQESLSFKFQSDLIPFLTLGLLGLVIFYPFVVLHIKRLRDIKLSYWWTLLTLIPVINILFEIFLCLKGPPKQSKDKINKIKSQKSSSKHKQMKWSPYAYKKS